MPSKTPQHDTLMKLFVQLLGVGTFTLLAGASDEMGQLVVVFMVGIFVIWAIAHVSELQKMVKKI